MSTENNDNVTLVASPTGSSSSPSETKESYFPNRQQTVSPNMVSSPGSMSPQSSSATSRQSTLTPDGPSQAKTKPKHRRSSSIPHIVKETLDASVSESDDGTRQLNQYCLKQVIGRGAFGTVELAVDTNTGEEYAIKEFSKTRLRRTSQSNMLRKSQRGRGRGRGSGRGMALASQSSRTDSSVAASNDPLYPVRSEIAILKKLNHKNVVQLLEVLDDPTDDSLYMVFEVCKRGPILDVSLDQNAKPLDLEQCRLYFREMILGFEYLHENEIVHRDIKPDNLLLSADGTLKIVDFGVSEIFAKGSDKLKRSAGSPAFMAPEMCVSKRDEISGRATDLWSMGVTLYCLVNGHLPWAYAGVLDLYEAIKTKPYELRQGLPPSLVDLFAKILDKNPETRITMPELRIHSWVTNDGTDQMISTEENCLAVVTELTEDEIQSAVKKIGSVMTVVKAATKLKRMSMNYRTRVSHGRTTSLSALAEHLNLLTPSASDTEARSATPVEAGAISAGSKGDDIMTDAVNAIDAANGRRSKHIPRGPQLDGNTPSNHEISSKTVESAILSSQAADPSDRREC